jgi:spermidine synthase
MFQRNILLFDGRVPKVQPRAPTLLLPLLCAVFFASGLATLVYQIAWQRLLTVYYGVGPISIAVIVSVFLLGLGMGSLVGGWIAERVRRLTTLYASIEIILGAYGLASVPFLDVLGRTTAGVSYVWTALFSALFLLPPTMLMGATLPIVLKLYNRHTGHYLKSLSILYFVNTLGAATGSLVAAYGLISLFDLHTAIGCAIFLNLALASVILIVYRGGEPSVPVQPVRVPASGLLGSAAPLLAFVTGFVAIGYEIAWTLNISSILKSSPYMFSTILFVYLLGIALGSFGTNRLGNRLDPEQRRSLFFLLQVLVAITASVPIVTYKWLVAHTFIGSLAAITDSGELHPPFINFAAGWPYLWSVWGSPVQLFRLLDIFFWPIFFLLLPTILMGASFPLIADLAHANKDQDAKATGMVYFVNVLGNFAGTLVTGFVLLPYLGSEATFLTLALIGIAFGLGVTRLGTARMPLLMRCTVVVILAAWVILVFPRHGGFLYTPATPQAEAAGIFFDEGQSGVVNSRLSDGGFSLWINGLGHGGRYGLGHGEGHPEFYIEAYAALAAARTIDSVLVIGFGTGSIAEAILTADDAKNLTIVEINETLIKHLRRHQVFRDIFNHPQVRLVVDDARRLLYREDRKYDVILMDPLRPTTIYSNNIYSKEFYELVKMRLNPGGILMTYVGQPSSPEQMNTIASVYPYAREQCSREDAAGAARGDYVLASDQPIVQPRDVEAIIRESLPEKTQSLIAALRKLCPPKNADLSWDKRVPILTDKAPIAEYHLGLAFQIWRARNSSPGT